MMSHTQDVNRRSMLQQWEKNGRRIAHRIVGKERKKNREIMKENNINNRNEK